MTGFDWVWLGLTRFDRVWLGLTGFWMGWNESCGRAKVPADGANGDRSCRAIELSYRVCFFFVFFLNTELLWRRLWWLLTFPTGALVGVRQQQGRRTTDGVLRPSTLRSASTTLIRSFVFFYLFFLRHPFQPVSRFVHSCFLVFYFVFLFIFLGGWKAKERRTINKRTDGNKSSRLNGQLIATSEARLKEAAKEENTHREREREREREKENGWNEKRATRWSVPALRPDRSAPNRHLGLAASSTGLDCLLWLRAVHGVDHLKAGSPIPRLNSVETRWNPVKPARKLGTIRWNPVKCPDNSVKREQTR